MTYTLRTCVLVLSTLLVVTYGQTSGGCGQFGCPISQTCLRMETSFNSICVNNDALVSCQTCNASTTQTCMGVDANNAACACVFGGTAPNCLGVPCNNSNCAEVEECFYTNIGPACGNRQEVQTACAGCTENCYVSSVNPVEVSCYCYNSGMYPNCTGPYCNTAYCESSEVCLFDATQSSMACVDKALNASVCGACLQGFEVCAADTTSVPAVPVCQCLYGGQPGNCSGQPCLEGICPSGHMCYSGWCVDADYLELICRSCNQYSESCQVTGTNQVQCGCLYGGTPGACTGPQCSGNQFCALDETCMQVRNTWESQCISAIAANNCYYSCYNREGPSDGFGCFAVETTPGNYAPQCQCQHSGIIPNCTGPFCGDIFCPSATAQCIDNARPNSLPLCVDPQQIFCSSCGPDEQCASSVGDTANFAECSCVRPTPGNPDLCIPVHCSGRQCDGDNEICMQNAVGGPFECVCLNGYVLNALSGSCEQNGIFNLCTPCTSSDPPGTVCGCSSGQACEPAGTNTFKCACAPGFTLEPMSFSCKPMIERPPTFPGYCIVSGDPHIMSFDSRMYDYQGRCDYVLVAATNVLDVHATFGECMPATPISTVSCITALAFKSISGAETVEFDRNGAYADGVAITFVAGSHTLADGTHINSGGDGDYQATLPDGTFVIFSGFFAGIKLPQTYAGTVSGLCGDFNMDPLTDFKLRSGVIISDPVQFGDNWQVQGTDPVLLRNPTTQCPTGIALPDPFDLCSQNPDARMLCDVPEPLFPCVPLMDISRVYASCVYDACYLQQSIGYIEFWGGACQDMLMELNISRSCDPPCATGAVCSYLPNNRTTVCVEQACTCPQADRQDCFGTFDANTNQFVSRCICKEHFLVDPSNPDLCVPEGECGTVNCTRDNEYCSGEVGADGVIRRQCACATGFVRNLVSGECETPNGGVLSGCIVCGESQTTGCGCPNANETCILERFATVGRCVCKRGFVYSTDLNICVEQIVIPVPTPAVCQAYGDPHYSDLDGSYFSNQVCGDANMLTFPGVEVHVRQGECWQDFGSNPWVKCAKAVAVKIPSGDIIEVNDERASHSPYPDVLPRILVNGVQIGDASNVTTVVVSTATIHSGDSYTVKITFSDVEIVYRRYFSVSVQVSSLRINTTSGLCGNFNRQQDETGDRDEWMVGNSTLFATENTLCGGASQKRQSSAPARDPNCQLKATQKCGEILAVESLFPNCANLFDLITYYQNCLLDYCELSFVGDIVVQSAIDSATSRCEFEAAVYSEYVGGSTTGTASTTGTPAPTTGNAATTSAETSDASSTVLSAIALFAAVLALVA